MNEFLAGSFFKEFVIPFVTVICTIGVKVVSRKDKFIEISREDFAIGFDLFVIAMVLLVTYCSKMAVELHNGTAKNPQDCQEKLEYLPWLLFCSIIFLWATSTMVRLWGWKKDEDKVLNLGIGVIIPTIIGLTALLVMVKFVSE